MVQLSETQEAKEGRPQVQGLPGLYNQFKVSLDSLLRHCLKKLKS